MSTSVGNNSKSVEGAITPLLSSVVSALSTEAAQFTGERFLFGSGVEIFYEHYHRYVFAARNITSDQTVLDLGCGVGYGSLILANRAKRVVSIDRDQEAIGLLRGLIASSDVDNIEAICGDVDSLEQLINARIDVVVCHELIEHLPRDAQERLLTKISSGQAPFHKGTRLFISTPEVSEYNQRNREENQFHEFEFSKEEFVRFLERHFSHRRLLWQGSVTGNLLVPEDGAFGATAVGFVHWHDITRILGTVTERPQMRGVYLYGIASHELLDPFSTSVIVDQNERLVLEKLAIAASELNQKQMEVNRATEQMTASELRAEFQKQAHEKIKALQRENEMLGARLSGKDLALEVKLAMKIMQRMPNFIRVSIRRIVAFGMALRRA
jgi:2-polyprenyl-3-methyl-5-hydroxy-6-metoxy-1,4-benzoquinol methylase